MNSKARRTRRLEEYRHDASVGGAGPHSAVQTLCGTRALPQAQARSRHYDVLQLQPESTLRSLRVSPHGVAQTGRTSLHRCAFGVQERHGRDLVWAVWDVVETQRVLNGRALEDFIGSFIVPRNFDADREVGASLQ